MRITRKTLLKIASDTVEKRVRANRMIVAVYLCGSLLDGDPALGGSADIDLVFLHDIDPEEGREILRLTDQIHLDISHQPRKEYRQARAMRTDPWKGPVVYGYQILHDPEHFLDFVQASVRDQFYRPRNVIARSQAFLEAARQTWFSLQMAANQGPQIVSQYLEAVANAINALVSLHGPPLTRRRLLTNLFTHLERLERTEVYAGVLGLLGGAAVSLDHLRGWLPDWSGAYLAAAEVGSEADLHADRYHYYHLAFNHQLASERPSDALWCLLHSWTGTVASVPDAPVHQAAWEAAFGTLGLIGEGLTDRVAALDLFLDQVEETVEEWGLAQGSE